MKARRGKVLGLVLAGGEGGRLGPLTEGRAKPVLPFGGVYRLIDFPLSNCHHSRVSDVWVIQQYEAHTLSEHLANGRPWDLDRTWGGLRVVHPTSGEGDEGSGFYEGNADAIHRNRDAIERFEPELVLVLSADGVYRLDYQEVLERHRERGAEATAVTTTKSKEEAARLGTVAVDGSGRVTAFEYKPEEPRSEIVTTEVFVYDADVLLTTLAELEDEELSDFGDSLLPRLVERGKTWADDLGGYWRDVGTIESYWQAHMDLLEPEPRLRLDDPEWPILTRASHRPPARVEATARIEGSLISPGCTVSGRVVGSVLGPGVVVEQGVEVLDSVVLGNSRIAADISRTIVDEGADAVEETNGGETPAVITSDPDPT